MSIKIRLSRGGAKKRPYYYIVVANAASPRDGRYIEQIGTHNPLLPKDHADRVKLDVDRARHWLSVGAQPTDKVRSLLVRSGVIEGKLSREILEEGYVTEVPSRGHTPKVIPAGTAADAVAEPASA